MFEARIFTGVFGNPYQNANQRHSVIGPLDDLPHGLSMERAKIIPVSDRWTFKSHHHFPGNMYPSKFEVGNKEYKTNEHYYQPQCAAFHNKHEREKPILKARDGYEAKKLAKTSLKNGKKRSQLLWQGGCTEIRTN